jgi:SAM-dependent methyltransferase
VLPPSPAEPDATLVAALRADLTAAGYGIDGLDAAWGPVAAEALGRDDRVPALLALGGTDTPVAALARLFVLGEPVTAEAAAAALPALGLDGGAALGLLRRDGDLVSPQVDIRPFALADDAAAAAGGTESSWWVVSDLGALALGGELPDEHVLGAGAASSTLAAILVPTGSGDVLDLGTGSGVQALHAARTARRVVGTDVSPRALAFARLSAALNDVAVELRLGSLYEPVAGERFDRVLTNPPFVITPRDRPEVPAYTYRDGGRTGDGLVEAVVRGAAGVLAPGGIAQLLGNWEVRSDEGAARERVLDWASEEGLDAWVIERDLLDPAMYAETWIRDGGVRGGAREEQLVAAWLEDFSARGVTAVAAGYLLVRRPAEEEQRPTLRRYERLVEPSLVGAGAALAAGLDAHDWQRRHDDEALAARRLRVAPDVTEHRSYWPGAADPSVIELQQGGGFARRRRVSTALAAIVGACDGELPLGALAGAVADLLDEEPVALRVTVLAEVRELLVEGFLLPGA